MTGGAQAAGARGPYILAFDTANEVIAIGVGALDAASRTVVPVATKEAAAHRASNTQLLPQIDALLQGQGIPKGSIACVVCGRGPGSFTGVRICMATAKGIASALEVPLFGVSTLDAIAWQAQDAGYRGRLLVVADAMRKEVYPVRYLLEDGGITRLDADTVVKAEAAAESLAAGSGAAPAAGDAADGTTAADDGALPTTGADGAALVAGDALGKYPHLFSAAGSFIDEPLWTPTGRGLLLTAQAAWAEGLLDPFDALHGNPAFALPVYTRLSDAEENERIRLSKNGPKDLRSGVQEEGLRRDQQATAKDTTIDNALPDEQGIVYRPLDAAHAAEVAALEKALMGGDAWSAALVLDELPRKDRIWWAAYTGPDGAQEGQDAQEGLELVGYAGGWVEGGRLQVLKVAAIPGLRRRGIGRTLLALLAADGRDLGAQEAFLQVRATSADAQAFCHALGFKDVGTRPHYYADGEDALAMAGPLPLAAHDVAGMRLQVRKAADTLPSSQRPLILAIETSCDETAAAVVNGEGVLLSDVVASQVDFHARFGGVVPEIASRKHIEAICGVTEECLETAATRLSVAELRWKDLDAVAVTYAPGLVGALVVGVAFAKGAAWAAGIPFIGVNHLEGHIYAGKAATPDIAPPMVVSLVSGGHTMLVYAKDWGDYETLGTTLDDAVGEAFDKVAKAMGLGYPGGPVISKLAAQGDPKAIDFPRAMLHSGDLSFSLSGLKTAVVTYLHHEEAAGHAVNKADVAASFQQAVIDVQVAKAEAALRQTGATEFCLGGGVAANKALREAYEAMCARLNVRLTLPPLYACTDNAGMIALVALDRFRSKKFFGLDADAHPHADLDVPY